MFVNKELFYTHTHKNQMQKLRKIDLGFQYPHNGGFFILNLHKIVNTKNLIHLNKKFEKK